MELVMEAKKHEMTPAEHCEMVLANPRKYSKKEIVMALEHKQRVDGAMKPKRAHKSKHEMTEKMMEPQHKSEMAHEKPKRKVSAYAALWGKFRREGMDAKTASAKAKAELAKK
jgi:hypothetical protein